MTAERPRRSLRKRFLRRLGAAAGAAVLRLSGALTRVRVEGAGELEETLRLHGGVIYAFWHGRFWLLAARLRHLGPAVLVSLSEDGEVIARAARSLGYHPVRGSSSRGGSEGLRALEEELRRGRSAALTPDGPRGPRHRAQPGAAVLAARSGKPIVPVGGASRPAWNLGSWDRFQIPWPGARGAIVFGAPIMVTEGAEIDVVLADLEAALTRVERRAEEVLG